MKIKKIYVAGIVGFICLITGYYLISLFIYKLQTFDFVLLAVFILTFGWSINFWWSLKSKYELAEKTAKEFNGKTPGYLHPETMKQKIKDNLIKVIDNEYYLIGRR